jgi:peptidoglycan/LPS O-acetylase OafA/YrhL
MGVPFSARSDPHEDAPVPTEVVLGGVELGVPELPNLDLLRSVAVCLVVFSHAMLYSGRGSGAAFAGIAGVCMFFVHTCLVLMGSLERDPHPGRFYLRRIFRIYPLWLVILGVTMLLQIPASPPFAPGFGFHHPDWRDLLGNMTLLMNVYGYPDVVGASWTLPIEVQMYLILPFVFAFIRSFRVIWPLLVVQGYLMFSAWRTVLPMYTPMLVCAPYFLPGAMGYVLYQRKRLQRYPAWLFVVSLTGTIALMTRFGTLQRAWYFCLALGLGLPLFQQIRWPAFNRVTAMMARYSYGIYLTHIPAICFGVYVLRGQPIAVRGVALVTALVGLPVVFYHAVERPGIRLGSRLAGKIERGPEPRADERMMRMEPAP